MSDLPWHEPAFLADVTAWIDARLADACLRRTGPIEQPHAFWWSTALRFPTDDGPMWCKAVQPDGRFEVRLTALLAGRWPDRTVAVVAADAERGWMLTRDAGTKLRELDDGRVVEHWEALLPRYAEMQRELTGSVGELVTMGVPELRLASLPSGLASLLEEPELLLEDRDGGVDADRLAALRSGLPAFTDACARLAALPIPETLQHDDLNEGNAFLREADHVVFDWGDAVITHPFHSLVVALRSLAYRHKWQPGGPEVERLLAAYLEPWSGVGSRAELADAADLARWTGTIQRSLAWRRAVLGMPPDLRSEYVDSVPYGLRLALLDGPWGTWDDGSF
ncbi:MAG TPA: phosphotransferase [Candidatus Limnocylindria bacterium]|jgi:hypothetical protein